MTHKNFTLYTHLPNPYNTEQNEQLKTLPPSLHSDSLASYSNLKLLPPCKVSSLTASDETISVYRILQII